MDEDLLRIIVAKEGVFLRREALECGYTDKILAQLRRRNVLHRVRHGAYTFDAVWGTFTPEEKHLVLARAVMRQTPGHIVFSHITAMVAHGIDVWGVDLTRVHATRLDRGRYRKDLDVNHHRCLFDEEGSVLAGGLDVTPPARAVIESASVISLESALVSADSALHLRLTGTEELQQLCELTQHWPGARRIHATVAFADGRSESVGESRSRWFFRREGLPVPDLQFEVHNQSGVLFAVTDFAWHDRKAFGEFDGKEKYMRGGKQGEQPGDVVFREKRREDDVRAITGYGCGRLVWADLATPRITAARFRRLLGLD